MAKFGFRVLWIGWLGMFYACTGGGNQQEARELSATYCASCHLSPDPQWLDQNGWAALLPHMEDAVAYRDSTGMAENDLQQIVAYFQAKAPAKLSLPEPVTDSLPYFQAQTFRAGTFPAADVLHFHPTRFRLFASAGSYLLSFDKHLKPDTLLNTGHPITQIQTLPTLAQGQTRLLASGGNRLTALSQMPGGPLQTEKWEVPLSGGAFHRVLKVPVMQKDKDDLLCVVANELRIYATGETEGMKWELVWTAAEPDWKIVDVQVIDFQFDNLPDFLVLTAGGNPRLLLFENTGERGFERKTLWQFPPVFAPSGMLVFDIDRDGLKDVLLTSGRADRIRPYDGLYIYRNMGDHVVENYFHHLPGAVQIGVWDFDRDGYSEMVAIGRSETGAQSFLYFDQRAPLEFDVKTLSLVASEGFQTLAVGDYDTDGDADIILLNAPGGQGVLTVINNLLF